LGTINDLISYIGGTSLFLWFIGILRGAFRAGKQQLLYKSIHLSTL